MKNGKMKFILAFFILPDDKKRPYLLLLSKAILSFKGKNNC